MIQNETKTCSCCDQIQSEASQKSDQEVSTKFAEDRPALKKVTGFAKASGSILLSFLYAFFPKCPICWAAWMSVFGSVGLSKIPYQPWLLPIMCALLILHLAILARGIRRKGYGPFVLSLVGAAVLLLARYWEAGNPVLYTGLILIGLGAFWNSFSTNPQQLPFSSNFLYFRRIFKA